MSLCTIAAIVMITFITIDDAEGQSPILFVPGFMNSQLYSRKEPCNIPALCPWKGQWISLRSVVLNNLKLEYNEISNTYHNRTGVGIKAAGFGITCRAEYVSATLPKKKCGLKIMSKPFHVFVNYFVENVGYERDHTIRAAPYDWRLTPVQHEQMGYYSNVKQLIEEMYKDGGNKKVTLVVHSMGGPVTLYFLNNIVDQDWKNKYIHAFVPLGGAWSGGGLALKSLISGLNPADLLNSNLPNLGDVRKGALALLTRDFTRTLPGQFLLLPNTNVWKDEVLVTTDSKNYTANDYEALFGDVGYPVGFTMYSNGISDINAGYPAPNVPTYCYYGTGYPTAERFVYNEGFIKDPTIIFGPGDGTVNLKSSEVCLKWADEARELEGVRHNSIPSNADVLSAVKKIVTSI